MAEKKKKTINSRQKGARGERELASELRKYGFTESRRGQQFSGKNGDADVVGIPGIHIECKRVERLNLDVAYKQSTNDARDGEVPIVVHRRDREKWMVTLSFEDFMEFLKYKYNDISINNIDENINDKEKKET